MGNFELEKPQRFGQMLRELRVGAGLSQETLAERASMSANGISALERGVNRAPQRETLSLLIAALGLDPAQADALAGAATRPSVPRAGANRQRGKSDMLPASQTPFFGRLDELDVVMKLLGSTSLVTLTGPGGIGKTRVALKVGEELAGTFSDGVRFVDLAPVRDPQLVGYVFAAQFGVKGCEGEEISLTIARGLRPMHALVIMDNCEHVLEAAASLAETVLRACPDIRIIATSRQPLDLPGEHIYRINALAVSAAVELFAERARRSGGYFALTDHNSDSVERIVRHLDGIALAIELAASRLNVLTLDQLEARLSKRFQVLTGGSARMQSRHQTMRTAIDWSYNLLDPEERAFFRRLWVFPNGFSLEAALHVCGDEECDEKSAFDSLSSLVIKSLVVSEDAESVHRFRLLETIREYAAEKAEEASEAALLQRRHAEYFAALAETADCDFGAADSTSEWLLFLEPELDNFRVALQWALGPRGDTALGVDLITKLQEFWIAQGFAKDIARRAGAMLAALHELTQAQHAALWLTLARMRQELFAHPHEMLEAAAQACDLCERTGDRGGLALALRQRGTALMRLGEFSEAESEMRRSLELYRALGDRRMVVRGMGYLATLFQMRGDHAEARSALLDVLQLAQELGDDRMVPNIVMNIAETEFALGHVESAARRARENLTSETLQKSPEMRATQTCNLAAYLFAMGETEEARETALASIQFTSGSFVAVPLQHIAAVVAPSDPKRAARLLGYVEAAFQSTAFARQYTEGYTYDALMRTLKECLDEELLGECIRDGASMSDKHALRLAGVTAQSS